MVAKKKGFKKYGSYFCGEKKLVLMNNISLANDITSGLKTHLGEQQLGLSFIISSKAICYLFVFKAQFNTILSCL